MDRERIEREVMGLPHFALQLGEPGCKAHMFEIAHGFYVAHKDVTALVLRERAAVWDAARQVLEHVDPRFPMPDGGYGIDWSGAIEDAIKELTALAAQERDQ